jgi:hypothetical protein
MGSRAAAARALLAAAGRLLSAFFLALAKAKG